jgi:hypothetical protein
MGTMGSCPGATRAQGRHANLGMLCMTCYLMFKQWVYWKYQYHKCLILSTIYIFIPVSGCVVKSPGALFCTYNSVKTALRSSDVDEVLIEWPGWTCRCWFSCVKCNVSSMWPTAMFCLRAQIEPYFCKANQWLCR